MGYRRAGLWAVCTARVVWGAGRTAYRKPLTRRAESGVFVGEAGDGLLSHPLSRAVPSALQGLTTEFGMGSGVALAR